MEIVKGSDVSGSVEFHGSSDYCDFFGIVKKTHEVCGDSAFSYCDENKTIIGVFDGVSGEPGADMASSEAASAFLDYLKKFDKINKEKMEKASQFARQQVKSGYTTATVVFLQKDGAFLAASVGDSPLYGINKNGEIDLELPLSRPTGDNDSILKFLYLRVFVSTVFGGFDSATNPEIHLNMRKGKLAKGELLLLASDCLVDNLFIEVKEGYVTESSGKNDLKSMVGDLREPSKVVKKIYSEIEKRVAGEKIESPEKILVPKPDDLAIIALRRI